MSAANNGKDAEEAFFEYWNRRGHVERIRDRKDLMGINKGKGSIADFKKPSDFLVSSPTDPLHYAEVKSTVDAKSFSFNKIQDGQSVAAQKAAARGDGAYFFYIFSYPLGKWFIMSCKQYAAVLKDGRKSIKFTELEEWVR